MMSESLSILMVTSEWPTAERPNAVPFIVSQVKHLRAAGVRVEVFSFRGGRRPAAYLRARNNVASILKRGTFDLIHAQWGQSALLALPKKTPMVVTFRGDDAYGIIGSNFLDMLAGWVLRLVSQYAARIADERVVVSSHIAARLGLQDYHVIPSGVDLNAFYPSDKSEARTRLGLSNKKLVLFVGDGNNPRKRLQLIREAVRQVQASMPDVDLVCVSSVAHAQVPLYMNACDVLVLASVHEGSPNVVKEALACNLPIVATEAGDVRERMGAVEGCFICKNDRAEDLAAALLRALSLNRRVSGRQAVMDLNEPVLTQALVGVYRQAIGKARR